MNKNSAVITNNKIVSMILVSKSNLTDFNKELECISNGVVDYVPVGGISVTSTYCHLNTCIYNTYSQLFVEYAK